MLKLPALNGSQGSGGTAIQQNNSEPSKTPGKTGFIPNSVTAIPWQQQQPQQQVPTAQLSAHQAKFRSAAIHCEVKLNEALSRTRMGKHKDEDESDVPKPDPARTAVCMQMLSELCELSGPFAHVLMKIRDELVSSTYSDYYTTEDGSLAYQQTPFFAVVGRLEGEKAQMVAEREQFRAELIERASEIGSIEERMRALEQAVRSERDANMQLTHELDDTKDALERARAECKQTKDELKRIRRELSQVQKQSGITPDMENTTKELGDVSAANRAVREMEAEVAHLLKELEDLNNETMTLISREDHEAVELELAQTKEQLAVMKEMVGDRMSGSGSAVVLTPRPGWDNYNMKDIQTEDKSTADIVKELKDKVDSFEFWPSGEPAPGTSYREALALIPPDPDLSKMPDLQAVYDVVDGLQKPLEEDMDQDVINVVCPALGLGKELPRYLRYSGDVPIKIMSRKGTLTFIREMWEAKAERDMNRMSPMPLPEYLFVYIRSLDTLQGSHKLCADFAYNLIMSARRFAYDPEVKMFLKILLGQLPEEAHIDCMRMESGLRMIFRAVDAWRNGQSDWSKPTTSKITMDDAVKMLNRFFPEKKDSSQVAIHQALHESVRGSATFDYEALFTDDPHAGKLLSTLRKHHIQEVIDYQASVEAYLLGIPDMEAKLRGLDPGAMAANMPLATIRDAFTQFDEDKPPAEVDLLIKRGAQFTELSDVPIALKAGESLPLKIFINRLKSGLVKSTSNYDLTATNNYVILAKPGQPVGGPAGLVSQPGMPGMS